MQEYIEFVWQSIFGTDPVKNNLFFRKHKGVILATARLMREKYPVTNKTFYRGIILNSSKVLSNTLEPKDSCEVIYFTEDRKVAEFFADKNSEVSKHMARSIQNAKGYVVEHEASDDEVLFHYSWAKHLGLDTHALLYNRSLSFGKDAENLIQEQKEVVLQQRGKLFLLKPL
jgi:hypothetical protein